MTFPASEISRLFILEYVFIQGRTQSSGNQIFYIIAHVVCKHYIICVPAASITHDDKLWSKHEHNII